MSVGLKIEDVLRLAEPTRHRNPLIAGPARERIIALAQDRSLFADEEAWIWANDLRRRWGACAQP
jgi:hypothetical protein